MSLPIAFRPEARAELIDAWSWYEEQRPGLGDELEACVEAAIGAAARSPAGHQRVYAEVRRVLVKRFPYGVYYLVEGEVLLGGCCAKKRGRRSAGPSEPHSGSPAPLHGAPGADRLRAPWLRVLSPRAATRARGAALTPSRRSLGRGPIDPPSPLA